MRRQPARFQVPSDGSTYVESIVTRCTDLVTHQIWEGIHVSRLRRWMANFTSDEERYFAACLLDSLVYRSTAQTVALINQLFQRVLPDLTRLDPSPLGYVDDWLSLLRRPRSQGDPAIRLVAVVQQSDPPTKSAYIVARLMKRHLKVRESWIIKPWELSTHIEAGAKVFIFIDDFLGTGGQFEKVVAAEQLKPILKHGYFAYAPLAAHVRGVGHLEGRFRSLRVRAVESLNSSHSLFHRDSKCFDDGQNTPESAKAFYYRLLRRKGIRVTAARRGGFGHLQLAYVFEHAAPNNCLPLLWWSSAPDFRPLFDR